MEPGNLYHLYTHANGFENLFKSEENYRYFLRRYEHFIPAVADTLAYCLMPNHIHFLIRIKSNEEIEQSFPNLHTNLQGFKNLGGFGANPADFIALEKRISQQFSNLFNGYTKALNKMYSRRGSLFIPNFKRNPITNDSYFNKIIHYIHTNPVHHGFVKNLTDWRWSSYHALLNNEPTFLKADEVISWFGAKEEFVKFHQQPIAIKTRQEFDF